MIVSFRRRQIWEIWKPLVWTCSTFVLYFVSALCSLCIPSISTRSLLLFSSVLLGLKKHRDAESQIKCLLFCCRRGVSTKLLRSSKAFLFVFHGAMWGCGWARRVDKCFLDEDATANPVSSFFDLALVEIQRRGWLRFCCSVPVIVIGFMNVDLPRQLVLFWRDSKCFTFNLICTKYWLQSFFSVSCVCLQTQLEVNRVSKCILQQCYMGHSTLGSPLAQICICNYAACIWAHLYKNTPRHSPMVRHLENALWQTATRC